MVWLDCDTGIEQGVKLVMKLNSVRFVPNTRIIFRDGKNFRDRWISRADLVQTTNVLDHAKPDMHVLAMNLLRRDQV